jgi:hypothetical protein
LKIVERLHTENPSPGNATTLAIYRARCGAIDAAIEILESWRAKRPNETSFLFMSGCVYSVAASKVGDGKPDAELNQTDRDRRQKFIDRAYTDLEQVYRLKGAQTRKIPTDPDLNFLHDRPEFPAKLAGWKSAL